MDSLKIENAQPVKSTFQKVQPLYFIDKAGRPVVYGIGTFFGKRPAGFFRLQTDSDQFTVPNGPDTDKRAVRIASLAKLMQSKLVLTSLGQQILHNPEHTYYFTVKTIADKAKVDTSVVSTSVVRTKQDDLSDAFSMMDTLSKTKK